MVRRFGPASLTSVIAASLHYRTQSPNSCQDRCDRKLLKMKNGPGLLIQLKTQKRPRITLPDCTSGTVAHERTCQKPSNTSSARLQRIQTSPRHKRSSLIVIT